MSTTLQTSNLDSNIISSIVIKGDLSALDNNQKVQYYRQFCDRLGLDPISQPFSLLKLQGKEILYCNRSGAQQLNKIHQVSHGIISREVVNNIYVVTARATKGTQHTESIGAVNIEGLKGEALANAYMKAETKAKRRATLDLLGLGILDETEAETIQETQAVVINEIKVYDTAEEVAAVLEGITRVKDLGMLYELNSKIVEGNTDLKQAFTEKKKTVK